MIQGLERSPLSGSLIFEPLEDPYDHERLARKSRVEKLAQDYLHGNTILIQSASLHGPFNQAWKNPWAPRSKQKSPRSAVSTTQTHTTAPKPLGQSVQVPVISTSSPRFVKHYPLTSKAQATESESIRGVEEPLSLKDKNHVTLLSSSLPTPGASGDDLTDHSGSPSADRDLNTPNIQRFDLVATPPQIKKLDPVDAKKSLIRRHSNIMSRMFPLGLDAITAFELPITINLRGSRSCQLQTWCEKGDRPREIEEGPGSSQELELSDPQRPRIVRQCSEDSDYMPVSKEKQKGRKKRMVNFNTPVALPRRKSLSRSAKQDWQSIGNSEDYDSPALCTQAAMEQAGAPFEQNLASPLGPASMLRQRASTNTQDLLRIDSQHDNSVVESGAAMEPDRLSDRELASVLEQTDTFLTGWYIG